MALPFVISIPHCASRVPEEIRSTLALSDNEIMEAMDFGTREIFGRIPALETVKATWSRLVVDPNRAPDRLDSKGVTAMTDYHGRSIFSPALEPDRATIVKRVSRYHRPYHAGLEKALHNSKAIALIDGHSLNGYGPADAPDHGQKRKDIILSNNGDTDGRQRPSMGPPTCSREQIHLFRSALAKRGLSVSLNFPYQGGYIVKHYGNLLRPSDRFAIQIELNQDLYMTQGDLVPEARRIRLVGRIVHSALEEVAASLVTPSREQGTPN